ncbi:hypothetical protein F5148DRAFT_565039 [Russula earlei]|uniref:Uncharacterized protein n=1 Tax=Russula earlei TaxID=71964 RepID=A0ACC0UP74_9AGAM|nr:hypothetical protein F5148DRAFT_565039 [Russula earlei]
MRFHPGAPPWSPFPRHPGHSCPTRHGKTNHWPSDRPPLLRHMSPISATAPSRLMFPSNATTPISYIPVELLTQIFIHVPRIEFEESLRVCPQRSQRPTWMAIAQVCRHWRAIAADCKDFWSYIPFEASMHWVELSLARSYPRPISFLLNFSTVQPEWYNRAALSALRMLPRAREVHLQGSAAASSEFRREALRLLEMSSAPVLEAFSIQGHTSRDIVTLSVDIFLRHDAAALTSLSLAYCNIHPSPLFRAPLASLRLVNCQVEFPLHLLGLLPQLRTLVLENTHGTWTRNPASVLRLPQLQNFELTNVSDVIAFILRGILIPSSTSLFITCTDYESIDEPIDDLTLLRLITSNMSPVLSTYLERAFEDGNVFPLLDIASPTSTAKKTLALLDPAPDSGTRQLRLSLIWVGMPDSTDLFSQMLSAFPTPALRRVYTLRMHDTLLRKADARSRPAPFAALHNKARDEAVRGLLAIVTRQEFLPSLRQVSLEGIDLKDVDIDLLARALVHRQRAVAIWGGKISLSLQNCLVSDGMIRGLRDYLGPEAVDVG